MFLDIRISAEFEHGEGSNFFVTFLTYKYGWGHARGRGQFFIFFTLVWKCGWDNFFSSSTSNFFILWLIHFLHWYWIVLRRKINFRVGEFFTYYFWLRLSLEKEAFFLWIYIQNSKQLLSWSISIFFILWFKLFSLWHRGSIFSILWSFTAIIVR